MGKKTKRMTHELMVSYLSRNKVALDDLEAVHARIHDLAVSILSGPAKEPDQEPAVPIADSIPGPVIICLEDGKEFKSLKRHLRTKYDMTPEQYRQKWGLPLDYPMVAPEYAAERSRLAKKMGLGRS